MLWSFWHVFRVWHKSCTARHFQVTFAVGQPNLPAMVVQLVKVWNSSLNWDNLNINPTRLSSKNLKCQVTFTAWFPTCQVDCKIRVRPWFVKHTGFILCMRPANERCYNVKLFLIDWAHTQNDPEHTTCWILYYFWGTHLKTDVLYMFYTKFHSPRSISYSPSSKCTRLG